jgi:hypothetical protein
MITYHKDLVQGSDEWLAARRGLITASEMKLILTPTLKIADNDKTRAHMYELLAQRISGYVEPRYVSDDMYRGRDDEIYARMEYVEHIAPVEDIGFVTNSRHGFTIGYSPDGLIGEDGAIEIKSRAQKYQVQTILDHVGTPSIPSDYVMQVQTGLLVTERAWCDFISYCGGLPMVVIRVYPDERIQTAILEAAAAFEAKIAAMREKYLDNLTRMVPMIETERRIIQEMYV